MYQQGSKDPLPSPSSVLVSQIISRHWDEFTALSQGQSPSIVTKHLERKQMTIISVWFQISDKYSHLMLRKVHCSPGRNNHTPTLDILTSVGGKNQEKKRMILSAAFTDIILLSQSSHSPHETHISSGTEMDAGKLQWYLSYSLGLCKINSLKLGCFLLRVNT